MRLPHNPYESMRLLKYDEDGELTSISFNHNELPPYAILSHTWGADEEEVTFADLAKGDGKAKRGYDKIHFCGQQAQQDGLLYFWVDTCCIDKTDKAELSQAIRSMFRWYQNATKCYVYLSDVSKRKRKCSGMLTGFTWEPAFRSSRWFKRGWTLQELLAPNTVEFYSQEWEKLGDKVSLKPLIRKITGIPHEVLDGAPLSQYSVDERLRWRGDRETKCEEDAWYSMSGIFDVDIAPAYSEGAASAFRRLMDEIHTQERCLQDVRHTDPRDDKKRIEDTKGGLLVDSYRWILDNSTFQQWQQDPHSRLLWVEGDPGKGKTMLLCGIIDELHRSMPSATLLSYFFCQATDSRINSATAVLRGLLYMLVDQQRSLISHVRKKHDKAGKTLFEDANAWIALTEIFVDVLRDRRLRTTYLVIDALDECVTDLPKLLDFVTKQSSASSRVKWIVSSRIWPAIEEQLERAQHKTRLSLELNAKSVTAAVDIFIRQKVSQLEQEKHYKPKIRDAVLQHLMSNANGTFLWVALVCHGLRSPGKWNVLKKLALFPPGLDSLYKRMMHQISESDSAKICRQVLASVAVLYQPVTIPELVLLIVQLKGFTEDLESVREIIGLCGSFLTLREDTVYFVHQSAKDFLFTKASNEVFPEGAEDVHRVIFLRSLVILSETLYRDMYSLEAPGFPIENVKPPAPDPLVALRYPCIYWIDHLCDWNLSSSVYHRVSLQDGGAVDSFLKKKYLYWLEALSLCKTMSKGVFSMAKLEVYMQGRTHASALIELVRDARRFIVYHKRAIENYPLQVYASALMFSPTHSLIRRLFKKEEPKGITIQPDMADKWSACLQTLEDHSDYVNSVAFSHDSARLASASSDKTVKIWDAGSGDCLQTLEGHSDSVYSVAFSHDSVRLASASSDETVKIWDAGSGDCLQTLEGHSDSVYSVAFSHDSVRLASASSDETVKIWDAGSGDCLQTLKGHSGSISSIAFSHDSVRLASASYDKTVKIWDTSSGNCLQTLGAYSGWISSMAFSHDSARLALASVHGTVKIWDVSSGYYLQTLEGHSIWVSSVAFSHDSTQLVSASVDHKVKIWDVRNSDCLKTLGAHSGWIWSVSFSHDSARLASASHDKTVKIWDASSGACLQTLEGHSNWIWSVAFSHDSTRLASASDDKTVKIWDANNSGCLQTLKGHSGRIWSVAFSCNSAQLASASSDKTVKIWDASSGDCLQTLEGHSNSVRSVAFSHDSARLASASEDKTVKIWNISSDDCLQTLEGHSNSVTSVAFSHDSTRLASASEDKTVKIWNMSSGDCLQTLKGHNDVVLSVIFSHDSAQLASTSCDETVKIWDANSGHSLQTLEGGSIWAWSVAFSHDSTRLALASSDNTLKIWDTSSSDYFPTLNGHSSWIRSIAFSHDSVRLASASDDETVKIWDAGSGDCLQTLEGHSDSVDSVAFSHDSARLASASGDKTVKIWNISSGDCLQTLEGHSDSVYSVAFSHDSVRLVSASNDETIKIWNISSGDCLQTLEGHSNSVTSVAFSHDSTRLASASGDKTVKIWNISSGDCLQTLEGHSDSVYSVAFSHDSARLASASSDKTVKIWDANSGDCLQTLAIGKALHNISFNPNNAYLHTEIGTIDMIASNAPLTSNITRNITPNIIDFRSIQYRDWSLSLDGVWIIYESENVVLLPSEYRPIRSDVVGKKIGIGVGSGKVWIYNFESKDGKKLVPRI